MTTNNHQAHGPVSLDRLHQISEILSKAAAQSDGGNIGYAMADAVKVINSTIAEFGAEPVAWTEKCEITNMQATGLYLRGFPDNSHGRDIALYTAPPAPVVPTFDEWLHISGNKPLGWVKDAMRESYDACRAAMLQAGNSPVTPDGWINCRERLPKPNKYVLVCNGVWVGVGMYNNAEHFEDDERWQDEHGEFIDLLHHPVTHWQSLPAAPKQENV
ncbi:hypothetical protein AI2602V1_1317 [Citrobacter freundii]|uniref:DUF551 domain-containing protein n=1 Tax=Citrobacter freundii TaxID=546 RepID=UPI001D7E3141|nr:DUF551 domain-containing protein [Citrobacter freundii]CAE6111669.1 hypothetical protein AI2602V1_1317 [Citrobacter freundii]CAH3264210.1 hypothetical protein AI2602V1_1317 [Citrobacter freundii]CAH6096862.1 hypothetical protein AI3058V1_2879 [Citrobacter freundii]